jgi:cysteine-S-conjugate beta-lyase
MAAATNPLEALSLAQLRARTSIKWRHYDADVLPLWVAEMDVPLAEPIAAALTQAIAAGDTGYPAGSAYAEAMAAFAAARWSWSFDPAASVLVPDVMRGVVEMLKLVTSPGDAVVVNSPVYTPFYLFVEHADRRVLEAPLGADHRIDLGTLERALAQAAAGAGRCALLLCSPHNPTGTVHTRAELEAAGALAARFGARVIVDEIHAPIVLPGSIHVPYLSLPVGADGFALLSASKGWNLAAAKAAVAVAGERAVGELERVPPEVRHGASHLGAIAHVAALRHGGAWLDELLRGLDRNRRLLGELLARHLPEVGYREPQGTYLAWLDCRTLGLAEDPAAVFLERGRVALNSGPSFGTGGEGHVRLNLATSAEILEQAVRRMAAALQR